MAQTPALAVAPAMVAMTEPLVMRSGVEMTPPGTPHESYRGSGQPSYRRGPSVIDPDMHANLCCPNAVSCCLSSCCFCVWGGCCLRKVEQNQNAAVMVWGKYVGSVTKPGLHIVNPFGTEFRLVSTALSTMDFPWIKVTDAKGNPILMRGFLKYQVGSAKKAVVDTAQLWSYVRQQAPMTLRRVAAQHSYDAIRTDEHGQIARQMRDTLQKDVRDVGVEILHFDITDLTYAPEIMQAMLAKQAAEAMVDARRLVTLAAVGMACDCADKVVGQGQQLSKEGEEKIIKNIMTVVCSQAVSEHGHK